MHNLPLSRETSGGVNMFGSFCSFYFLFVGRSYVKMGEWRSGYTFVLVNFSLLLSSTTGAHIFFLFGYTQNRFGGHGRVDFAHELSIWKQHNNGKQLFFIHLEMVHWWFSHIVLVPPVHPAPTRARSRTPLVASLLSIVFIVLFFGWTNICRRIKCLFAWNIYFIGA